MARVHRSSTEPCDGAQTLCAGLLTLLQLYDMGSSMHRYRVYLACATARQIALRDGAGRYHRARIASALPPLWEELEGDAPALGFGLLVSSTGRVFRAYFDAIDAEQRIELVVPDDAARA